MGALCYRPMTLHKIQRCVSTEPYFEQEVPSDTQPNLVYVVYSVWPDDPSSEYTCSCEGFKFRGHCKHQELAWNDRCLWEEDEKTEKQTTEQREAGICPRCGNETVKDIIDE